MTHGTLRERAAQALHDHRHQEKMERWEAFRHLLSGLLGVSPESINLSPDDESYEVEGLWFRIDRETSREPYKLYFEATSRLGGPTFTSEPFTDLLGLGEQWEHWVVTEERQQREREQREG